jgi:hypothetical protein
MLGDIRLRRLARAFLTACAVAAAPVPAGAGPSIPEVAAPEFSDPLSRLREQPAAARPQPAARPAAGAAQAPAAGAADPAFTILGETGTERLGDVEPDDSPELLQGRFRGETNDPLDGETAFSSGGGRVPAGSSLADLAQALINQGPAGGGAGGGGQSRSAAQGAIEERSLLATVLDETLTEVVISVLNPKIETDGLISFSIAGFGSFALMSTGETGGIFFVDMEAGTAIKIYNSATPGDLQQGIGGISAAGGLQQPTGTSNSLQRILEFLDRYILPVVTSPITLAAVALFAMIWFVWRVSARER